jgi:hypothetical protein
MEEIIIKSKNQTISIQPTEQERNNIYDFDKIWQCDLTVNNFND